MFQNEARQLFASIKALLPLEDSSNVSQEPSFSSNINYTSLQLASGVDDYIRHLTNESSSPSQLLDDVNQLEVHEAFTQCCLHAIDRVVLLATGQDCDALFSVYQEQLLTSCLEFVICLDVYPRLAQGVALPLNRRLTSHACLSLPSLSSEPDNNRKLMLIARSLLQLIQSSSSQLNRLIGERTMLGDLFAILAQVAFAPPPCSSLESDCQVLQQEARDEFESLLFNRIPRPLAMVQLMILQGGGGAPGTVKPAFVAKGAVPLPPAPSWLRQACAGLLSRLLIAPFSSSSTTHSGFKHLLVAARHLTPGIVGDQSSIHSLDPRLQPELASALALIVTSPPRNVPVVDGSGSGNKRAYYELIAKQVIDVLLLGIGGGGKPAVKSPLRQFGYLVALTCVHLACVKGSFASNLFLWPLLKPLRLMTTASPSRSAQPTADSDQSTLSTSQSNIVTISPRQLTQMLTFFSDLLSCPNRSNVVVDLLLTYSQPLFELLVQATYDDDALSRNENDNSSSRSFGATTAFTAFKHRLIRLLLQLLSVGCSQNAHRVALIRRWLGLASNTDSPMPKPMSNSFVGFIQSVLIADNDDQTSCSDTLQGATVPYKCHLDRNSCRSNSSSPSLHQLDHRVQGFVELLSAMLPPTSQQQQASPDDDPDQHCYSELIKLNSPSTDVDDSATSSLGRSLTSELFVTLISDLNEGICRVLSSTLPKPGDILLPDHDDEAPDTSQHTNLLSSTLAALLLDRFPHFVWPSDPERLVSLFTLTLSRFALVIKHTDDNQLEEFITDSLTQLLGLLTFYIGDIPLHYITEQDASPVHGISSSPVYNTPSPLIPSQPPSLCPDSRIRQQFARLLPHLTDLHGQLKEKCSTSNSTLLQLIDGLKASLLTRGAVPPSWSSVTGKGSTCTSSTIDPSSSNFKPTTDSPQSQSIQPVKSSALIEELASPVVKESEPTGMDDLSALPTILSNAFAELNDPLVPVRGHALIVLSRLIEDRDPVIKGREEILFKCLQKSYRLPPQFQLLTKHLSDMDSYIYLNCIRGLAALGNAFTGRVLDALLHNFVAPSSSNDDVNSELKTAYRVKMGEAIVRVLRNLGQTAASFRDKVFVAFRSGSHDVDPLIRATSLSNLGEFCRLLGFAIQPVVYEIFALLEINLCQDESPLVRQSACHLARSLIDIESTFTNDVNDSRQQLTSILPGDLLRDLHRLLRNRSQIERQADVCEQIDSCLGLLHERVKSSLFLPADTPEKLIKQIKVLRP